MPGQRRLWLAYPETEVVVQVGAGWHVRRLTKSDALDGGDVIPGLAMPLTRPFR